MKISIPFGRESISEELPDERVRAVLRPRLSPEVPGVSEEALVRAALRAPIGSPPLEKLARGRRRILLITSDHTRPVPSARTLPLLRG